MNLDLGGAGRDGEAAKEARVAAEIGGDAAAVALALPGGERVAPVHVQVGQTVMYLKALVEKEHGIKMSAQQLFCNDRLMIDPLSLVDCGIAGGSSVLVEVRTA